MGKSFNGKGGVGRAGGGEFRAIMEIVFEGGEICEEGEKGRRIERRSRGERRNSFVVVE